MTYTMVREEAQEAIQALEQCDDVLIKLDDFNYHVERVRDTEYRVSKLATTFCLEVKYFETIEQILDYMY